MQLFDVFAFGRSLPVIPVGIFLVLSACAAMPDDEPDTADIPPGSIGLAGSVGVETALDKLKSILSEEFYLSRLRSDDLDQQRFIQQVVLPERIRFHEQQAMKIYRLAIEAYPQGLQAPAAQFKIAEIFFSRGEYDQAADEYNRLIDKYSIWRDFRPSDYCDDAQYKLGLILMKQGRYEEAIETFYTLIDSYVDSDLVIDGYRSIADCLAKLDDLEGAISVYDKVRRISRDSDISSDALLKQGRLRMVQDELDSAIRVFSEVVKLMPDSPQSDEAMFRIGEAYMRLEDYEQARIRFRKVMGSYELNPHLPEAFFQLARSYFLEEKYSQAVDAFSNLLVRHVYPSKEHEIFKLLGQCYEELYLNDRAIEVYKRMYQQRNMRVPSKEMVRVHYRIGQCYSKLGKYDEAVQVLRQVALSGIDKELAENAAYETGRLLQKQQKFKEAIAANRVALAAFAGSDLRYEALLRNVQCYRGLGEFPKALRLVESVIIACDQDKQRDLLTRAMAEKADLYYELEDYDNALPVYERLYQREIADSGKPQLVFRLARCCEEAARFSRSRVRFERKREMPDGYKSAAALYRRVIDEFGDSVWAQQARLNLQTMELNLQVNN